MADKKSQGNDSVEEYKSEVEKRIRQDLIILRDDFFNQIREFIPSKKDNELREHVRRGSAFRIYKRVFRESFFSAYASQCAPHKCDPDAFRQLLFQGAIDMLDQSWTFTSFIFGSELEHVESGLTQNPKASSSKRQIRNSSRRRSSQEKLSPRNHSLSQKQPVLLDNLPFMSECFAVFTLYALYHSNNPPPTKKQSTGFASLTWNDTLKSQNRNLHRSPIKLTPTTMMRLQGIRDSCLAHVAKCQYNSCLDTRETFRCQCCLSRDTATILHRLLSDQSNWEGCSNAVPATVDCMSDSKHSLSHYALSCTTIESVERLSEELELQIPHSGKDWCHVLECEDLKSRVASYSSTVRAIKSLIKAPPVQAGANGRNRGTNQLSRHATMLLNTLEGVPSMNIDNKFLGIVLEDLDRSVDRLSLKRDAMILEVNKSPTTTVFKPYIDPTSENGQDHIGVQNKQLENQISAPLFSNQTNNKSTAAKSSVTESRVEVDQLNNEGVPSKPNIIIHDIDPQLHSVIRAALEPLLWDISKTDERLLTENTRDQEQANPVESLELSKKKTSNTDAKQMRRSKIVAHPIDRRKKGGTGALALSALLKGLCSSSDDADDTEEGTRASPTMVEKEQVNALESLEQSAQKSRHVVAKQSRRRKTVLNSGDQGKKLSKSSKLSGTGALALSALLEGLCSSSDDDNETDEGTRASPMTIEREQFNALESLEQSAKKTSNVVSKHTRRRKTVLNHGDQGKKLSESTKLSGTGALALSALLEGLCSSSDEFDDSEGGSHQTSMINLTEPENLPEQSQKKTNNTGAKQTRRSKSNSNLEGKRNKLLNSSTLSGTGAMALCALLEGFSQSSDEDPSVESSSDGYDF